MSLITPETVGVVLGIGVVCTLFVIWFVADSIRIWLGNRKQK